MKVDEEGKKVSKNNKRWIVILSEIKENKNLEEVKEMFYGEGCNRII